MNSPLVCSPIPNFGTLQPSRHNLRRPQKKKAFSSSRPSLRLSRQRNNLFSTLASHIYMATFSGSILNFSGINGAGYPNVPSLQIHKCDTTGFRKFHLGTASASTRKLSFHGRPAPTPILCAAGRNYELDHNKEPFWLSMIQTVTWATRSLFLFLAEQPSQLRYIEWPSFQSTLKTAMLTLVLVALLIVALSSVDSALSYLLALFLRRKAWLWK